MSRRKTLHRRSRDEPLRWLLEAGAQIASAASATAVLDAFRDAVVPRMAERCVLHMPPVSLADSEGSRATELIVPLATRGQLLAIATLTRSRSPRPFTHEERLMVNDLARRAALALGEMQRRAAERDAHESRERVERLYAVAERLSTALTIEEVARAMIEATIPVFDAYAGGVALLQPDGRLALVDSKGFPDDARKRFEAFPPNEPSPVREAIETCEGSFYASREEVARRFPRAAQDLYRTSGASYANIPLVVHRKALGCLFLAFDAERGVMRNDHDFIEAVGRQCGLAISRAQLFKAERDARATAERAVAAREDFLTIASHEFRTPLATLKLYLDSLARAPHPTEAASDPHGTAARLAAMRRQVDRLTRLVHVLLDVSRASVSESDLSVEPLDLVRLAYDVAEGLANDATAARCRIEIDAPSPVKGWWDRLRIEQVLSNLLGNAIKFGSGGLVRMSIGTIGGDRAVIRVRDEGIGIPDDAQARVFERFERAVSSRNYPGFGLGLWIVKAIVEAHGGTVAVESTQGAGSTFTVQLPQRPGLAAPAVLHDTH